MSELPPGWTEAPLEALVDILDSARVPLNATEREKRIEGKPANALFPYYGATGQVGEIDDFLFDEPLLLLGEDGVPFFDRLRHKAYLVEGKCWVNNHAHVLRAIDGAADRRYLAGYLNVFDYNGFVTGSTRLKLTQAAMRSIPVSVAPFPEQKRIADKLDALLARVDACRGHLDRVPGILKRFRQSVLARATSGELTREWRQERGIDPPTTKTLGDVLKVSSGKFLPAKEMTPGGTIPVFGGNGVNGYHDKANVEEETLVIGRVGFYCGSVHLTPPLAWVTDNALIVHHDPSRTFRRFLYFALQAVDLRVNDSSTAQPVISGAKIYPTPIAIPDVLEQIEIVRRLDALLELAENLETARATVASNLSRMVPSVLAKAFRGELVPQDPNDEPASKLLSRLRTRADSTGNTAKPKRGGARGPRTKAKADTSMLTRKDVTPTHLTTLLKERGALTAEALWTASQLEIDDFYDQLKDEEARGLLRENRGDSPTAPRVLEAAA